MTLLNSAVLVNVIIIKKILIINETLLDYLLVQMTQLRHLQNQKVIWEICGAYIVCAHDIYIKMTQNLLT